jgi:hypothetical protein
MFMDKPEQILMMKALAGMLLGLVFVVPEATIILLPPPAQWLGILLIIVGCIVAMENYAHIEK